MSPEVAWFAITGPRIKVTEEEVYTVLDALFPDPLKVGVISGTALGTDTFAENWAKERGARVKRVKVNNALDGHDLGAPKRRNGRMVDLKPGLCVGFPGYNGTNDMLDRCHEAGIPVWEVEIDHDTNRFLVWQWPAKGATGSTAKLILSGPLRP